MNSSLENDLNRFCRVYLNNTSDLLRKLPMPIAAVLKQQMEEEFNLFRTSMFNRIEEEFRKH